MNLHYHKEQKTFLKESKKEIAQNHSFIFFFQEKKIVLLKKLIKLQKQGHKKK